MKNIIIASNIALILLFVASCTKLQTTLHKIDGAWNIISVTSDGNPVDVIGAVNMMYFEKCPMTYTACGGNIILNGNEVGFTYRISDDGQSFEATPFTSYELNSTYTIKKLDKENMVLSVVKDDKTIEYTMKKRR